MQTQKSIQINLPWSVPGFIPLNGFHPLYKPFIEGVGDSVEFLSPDKQKIYRDITCFETLLERGESVDGPFVTELSQVERDQYLKFFDETSFRIIQRMPGQIDFFHTAPLGAGSRPFVLHFEAFTQLFMPFAFEGDDGPLLAESIKTFYEKIFSSDLCLGVYSHIGNSIDSFNEFFGPHVSSDKVVKTSVAIPHMFCEASYNEKLNRKNRNQYLFINSAHQNPENFVKRGGHIILEAWPKILQRDPDSRLVVRCAKVSNDILVENGVDVEFVNRELDRSIIWLDIHLSDSDLQSLYKNADFFLLPSANLHSMSILSCFSFSCIPIVSDSIGMEDYVSDKIDGCVLNGVKKVMWRIDEALNVQVCRYGWTKQLENNLVSQLVDRSKELCSKIEYSKALLKNIRKKALHTFDPLTLRNAFWSDVEMRYEKFIGDNKPQRIGIDIDAWKPFLMFEDRIVRSFSYPPHPLKIDDFGLYELFSLAGDFVLAKKQAYSLASWFPSAENHQSVQFMEPAMVSVPFKMKLGRVLWEMLSKLKMLTVLRKFVSKIRLLKRKKIVQP